LKLFENIFKFNGGIQAETHKAISTAESIKKFSIPKKLFYLSGNTLAGLQK